MEKRQRNVIRLRLLIVLILLSGILLTASISAVQASSTTGSAPSLQGAVVDAPSVSWSTFEYIYVAGSTLRPRDAAQDWANSGSGGCIYATTNASEVMNVHLDIPTGSRIDYLRIFFYDTNAANSTAWVTTYDGASGFTDITSASTSGTGGYGTTLSAYVGHVVDNFNNGYVLNWRPGVTGNTMMLCGLRVAYRLPMLDIFLPIVRR